MYRLNVQIKDTEEELKRTLRHVLDSMKTKPK